MLRYFLFSVPPGFCASMFASLPPSFFHFHPLSQALSLPIFLPESVAASCPLLPPLLENVSSVVAFLTASFPPAFSSCLPPGSPCLCTIWIRSFPPGDVDYPTPSFPHVLSIPRLSTLQSLHPFLFPFLARILGSLNPQRYISAYLPPFSTPSFTSLPGSHIPVNDMFCISNYRPTPASASPQVIYIYTNNF